VWLRDSKQLAEHRREEIFEEVGRWCACWSIGHASALECDRWGMTAAQRLASRRALVALAIQPQIVLLDGPFDFVSDPAAASGPELSAPVDDIGNRVLPIVVPVVDGDARCAAVAAASVLAKVVRDGLMRSQSANFPHYAFARNKGYPSPVHRAALRDHGLSPIHRRSWSFAEALPSHSALPPTVD
jgi:ribonuclease HII